MSFASSRHARRIFIDTSAYFAWSNRHDINHAWASAGMVRLVRERRPLFTTNFVLVELHGLLVSRLDRGVAARVLAEIDASRLTTVVRVNAQDERRARDIVFGHIDKDYSFADVASFAVMERFQMVQAFTLDRHFSQFGWAAFNTNGQS